MAYHIALELTQEQVWRLKSLATSRKTTVKDLVLGLVEQAINSDKATKPEEPKRK